MSAALVRRLKSIVERSDSRAGRLFDRIVEALIIVSLVTFSIETLPDLSEEVRTLLSVAEGAVVAAFTVEYILRVAVADSKLRYITSFFGIIDLFAILPFYLTPGIDLRSLRAFRLLRLIRVLKLARYSEAVQRFHRAFQIAREEIVLFLGVACLLTYLSAVGIYYFESAAQPDAFKSIFHSLWWAVATLTTVGYGDIYPITTGGKIFTFIVLMIGLGIVAVPAGLVASALSQARRETLEAQDRTEGRVKESAHRRS